MTPDEAPASSDALRRCESRKGTAIQSPTFHQIYYFFLQPTASPASPQFCCVPDGRLFASCPPSSTILHHRPGLSSPPLACEPAQAVRAAAIQIGQAILVAALPRKLFALAWLLRLSVVRRGMCPCELGSLPELSHSKGPESAMRRDALS